MPRIIKKGFVPILQKLNYPQWLIQIEAQSDGQTYDITQYVPRGRINRRATTSLSNFEFTLDNPAGKYKGKFQAGDYVNFYYDYTETSPTVIRFRARIDKVLDNLSYEDGYTLSITGRDYPSFADTFITMGFSTANILDAFKGTSGSQDSQGNYANGLLHNSGLILKIYDPYDSTWKAYSDVLKTRTQYDKTVTDNFEDKSCLSISAQIASDSDIDWRIYYDSSDSKWYIYIHPEEAVKNTTERGILGQNLFRVSNYGKDTTKEANRIKTIGEVDGSITRFRTKSDTLRQSALWVKDMVQQVTDLNTDALVLARTNATLSLRKEEEDTGSLSSTGMPTLQPAEKIHISVPYIKTGDVLVKSFDLSFGMDTGFESNLDIKEREERFEDIFKNIINDQTNVIPTNNPNGMKNAKVYDFSDAANFSLISCEINQNVLVLKSGETTGTATNTAIIADDNITQFELRIEVNNYLNCEYRVSNDGGATFETYTLGSVGSAESVHIFTSVGKNLVLEITLEERNSASPEFNKINLMWK